MTTPTKLRVWWIREPPAEPQYFPVKSLGHALLKLDRLAKLDILRGTEYNVGGLEVFEDGEWVEWYSEDGLDIDGYAASLEETES